MMSFASIHQIAEMAFILLQLDFSAWRSCFTSSWSDCVGFTTDSRIFKSRLGSSCQRSYLSCLSPWNIIHGSIWWRSTRPGSVFLSFYLSIFLSFYLSIFLSFYLSIFLLITNQFGSVRKMKLHKGRIISEDDVDSCLEPTRISLDWCPTEGQQI
jgi:hypothetical protein